MSVPLFQLHTRRDLGPMLGCGYEWKVYLPSYLVLSASCGRSCVWKVANREYSLQSLDLLYRIPFTPFLTGYGEVPVEDIKVRSASIIGARTMSAYLTERADCDLLGRVAYYNGELNEKYGFEAAGAIIAASLWLKHTVGICVGDIKLENYLALDKGRRIALCDIGMGVRCGIPCRLAPNRNSQYFAPEALASIRNGTSFDPELADVFSIGCCIVGLLTGRRVVFTESGRAVYPATIGRFGPGVLYLIGMTLDTNPAKRAGLEELGDHPIIRNTQSMQTLRLMMYGRKPWLASMAHPRGAGVVAWCALGEPASKHHMPREQQNVQSTRGPEEAASQASTSTVSLYTARLHSRGVKEGGSTSSSHAGRGNSRDSGQSGEAGTTGTRTRGARGDHVQCSPADATVGTGYMRMESVSSPDATSPAVPDFSWSPASTASSKSLGGGGARARRGLMRRGRAGSARCTPKASPRERGKGGRSCEAAGPSPEYLDMRELYAAARGCLLPSCSEVLLWGCAVAGSRGSV